MPKTRRSGRKNQLRRIFARLYQSASGSLLTNISVEERYDPEYEALFKPGLLTPSFDKNNNFKLAKWPSKLTLITIDHPGIPPLDIDEKDPRRTRYLQIRAEILHQWYDAPTPEHWGTEDHPVLLDWRFLSKGRKLYIYLSKGEIVSLVQKRNRVLLSKREIWPFCLKEKSVLLSKREIWPFCLKEKSGPLSKREIWPFCLKEKSIPFA